MSLTLDAQRERMWGRFPALRVILESKSVPPHYYGGSSVSDNTFDQLRRLLELSILARENAAAITDALSADGAHRERLVEDLSHLRDAYRWAIAIFQDAAKEIDKNVRRVQETSPVKELAIRLAWYIDRYGPMSDSDLVQLIGYVNWPDRSGGKAIALLRLAAQLEKVGGDDNAQN